MEISKFSMVLPLENWLWSCRVKKAALAGAQDAIRQAGVQLKVLKGGQ